MPTCDVCGADFDSAVGLSRHKGHGHKDYMDKQTLTQLYWGEGMSLRGVADELGTDSGTISRWMDRLNVDKQNRASAKGGYKFSSDELHNLYWDQGYSTPEIAEMYGIDESNVSRQMKRKGVKIDNSGENHHGWKGGDVETNCATCGDAIIRSRSQYNQCTKHYCSDACESEAMRKRMLGENSPSWAGGKQEATCSNCGSKLMRWPSNLNDSENAFCDPECHGEWMSENVVGENHPMYGGGNHETYYGPNWGETREKRLEEDNHRCVVCGTSDEEHKEVYGVSLHIHHIRPKEEFVVDGELDYKRANRLENLVTLCYKCHRRWEGIPLRPEVPADD